MDVSRYDCAIMSAALAVGRKIRFLVDLEQSLVQSGLTHFCFLVVCFLVVGQGSEEPWLKANPCRADLPEPHRVVVNYSTRQEQPLSKGDP